MGVGPTSTGDFISLKTAYLAGQVLSKAGAAGIAWFPGPYNNWLANGFYDCSNARNPNALSDNDAFLDIVTAAMQGFKNPNGACPY
jgi:hypothetical protein